MSGRAVVAGEGALAARVAEAVARRGFVVERTLGGGEAIDLLVAVPIEEVGPRDLAGLGEEDWIDLAERPLNAMRGLLAAASPRLGEGAAVLIVLPNIGMVGLAGTSAQTMAAEGIRSLAKAVSRGWAGRGVRVNAVILSAAQVAAAEEAVADRIAAQASVMATGNSILIDDEQVSI